MLLYFNFNHENIEINKLEKAINRKARAKKRKKKLDKNRRIK